MAAGVTYTPIASTTLGSATSSITLSSISGSYTDLVLVFGYKANTTNYPTIKLTFNGSTSGYSGEQLYGTGSASGGSNRNTNAAFISIARAVGQPATVGNTATIIINIMDYSNSNIYKTVLARANSADTGTEFDIGLWQSNSAITQIDLNSATSNDFAVGSTVTLYGIAAA